MEKIVLKTERSAGIDIYKILCMFFVIWFHFSDHGSVLITANDEITFNWLVIAISSIFVVRFGNIMLGKNKEFWIFICGMEKLPCVLTSVFLFLWFSNLKIKYNKFIDFLSSSLFAVYLLHIGRLWKLFFRILFNNENTYYTNYMFAQIILCSVTIFFGAILFDKVRIAIFEKPIIHLLKTIKEKFIKSNLCYNEDKA